MAKTALDTLMDAIPDEVAFAAMETFDELGEGGRDQDISDDIRFKAAILAAADADRELRGKPSLAGKTASSSRLAAYHRIMDNIPDEVAQAAADSYEAFMSEYKFPRVCPRDRLFKAMLVGAANASYMLAERDERRPATVVR